ncbi:hypothetical protein GCM10023194_73820 [Planotetraspora phitsanulokensis]|uniref:Uncharacterized protein n=1 Tax=Planotetraspora phitsanulokensis TaxID=575192 RepID=A0A8J3U2F5_9ACTN|nr:hypothetical protein [Planotetraspora phitsanulokensis]GII37119.1 hypothetical protein Pph01_21220 [Planotetraspora phitsanulokensis]
MKRELTGLTLGAAAAGLAVASLFGPASELPGRSCPSGWDGFYCVLGMNFAVLVGLGALGAVVEACVLRAFRIQRWLGTALWSVPFVGCGALVFGSLLDWMPLALFVVFLYLLGNGVFFLIAPPRRPGGVSGSQSSSACS